MQNFVCLLDVIAFGIICITKD